MSAQRDIDQCGDHEGWLPAEAPRTDDTGEFPCSNSGPKGRIVEASCHIEQSMTVRADATLIISWQEVDRLLDKKEYAAALLVAAVNVEFILWENLRRFHETQKPSIQSDRIRSMWGQVASNHPEKLTLSSLHRLAECLSEQHGLKLAGSRKPTLSDIEDVRNRIAHDRGYFAKLTQLKDPEWPEARIRQVLDDAKQFCHDNAA